MDDDAPRLVDHEHVLVLVGDPERYLFPLQPLIRNGPHLDRLAALEAMALRPGGAVDEDGPVGEQSSRRGARSDLGQPREVAIEALAGGAAGNLAPARGLM
jgi:hypothetical protein